MLENTPKFKVKNIVKLKDVVDGKRDVLPESDICIQDNGYLIQYERLDEPKREKVIIKPGIYNMLETTRGINLEVFNIKKQTLLDEIVNTKSIIDEADFFFNRLHIYDELEIEKKRAVLLYGIPGCGKSSSITKIVNKLKDEDKGVVVLNWYSGAVSSDLVLDFLTSGSEFHESCTKLIVIVEDIGASIESDFISHKQVDRALLNLLDGVGVVYKIPTFFIATTNYAENLPENLANRPGRFDKMIEITPPCPEERVKLCEFIAKRSLTDDEKSVMMGKETDRYSIAHIKEVIVRAKLNNTSIKNVIVELNEHTKKFNTQFKEIKPNLGF